MLALNGPTQHAPIFEVPRSAVRTYLAPSYTELICAAHAWTV